MEMTNEKVTDIFIANLLEESGIKYVPNAGINKEVQKALKTASKSRTGKHGFPEFTAQSNDFVLVIEDKADLQKQVLYENDDEENLSMDQKSIKNYAENGALHYAQQIATQTNFKKVFAFGCTGDEKHHKIRPIFVDEKGYKLLPEVENFENFTEENIDEYYKEQVLGKTPKEIQDRERILDKAKDLHEALRNYGQLGDTEKPLVVSAILLALDDKDNETLLETLTGTKAKTDGEKIFDALKVHLKNVEIEPGTKTEVILNQFTLIKDRAILNKKDKNLGKTPLKYFTEYIKDEIFDSVKKDSVDDILGQFYGEFIRYSGGDGQTLGVVLTPKHVTELFSDLLDIKPSDIIFDPCCGTGGFLLAGMHKMLENAKTEAEKTHIKKNQVFGIEVREDMFSIATTNMILRGDGKSNLVREDFLEKNSGELQKKGFTVGLLNPPYSQRIDETTAHLSEIHFVEHLLDSLAQDGKCAVIVPLGAMIGNNKEDKGVKRSILQNHTLEGVITLNPETFYRIGTNPCIALFTAHQPHPKEKYCKFINFKDDGFAISKHIGLIETERAKEKKKHLLDCWIHDAPAETKFMVKSQIEPDDEWLHAYYYFNDEIPKSNIFEEKIADYLSFQFNMLVQGKDYLFPEEELNQIKRNKTGEVPDIFSKKWDEFKIDDLFNIQRGKRLKNKDHIKGTMPYISSTSSNNGIDDYVSNKDNVRIFTKCLTLANSGSVGACFYQPFEFVASDHVTKVSRDNLNKYNYLFVAAVLTRLAEKYSFNREISDKRLRKEKIVLPVDDKKNPDWDFMETYIERLEYREINKYLNYFN